jgi:hypothetical protein
MIRLGRLGVPNRCAGEENAGDLLIWWRRTNEKLPLRTSKASKFAVKLAIWGCALLGRG